MDNPEELLAKAAALVAEIMQDLRKSARADREISAKLAKLGFAPGAALWKFANKYDELANELANALEGLGAGMADNARQI